MSDVTAPIVVGVDGSATSNIALAWAVELADARGARLRIVHASGMTETYGSAHGVVTKAAAAARALAPGMSVHCTTPVASARTALMADTSAAGMLVVGARGSGGFTGMLAGSTALYLAAHAPAPVAVVRGRGRAPAVPADGAVVVGLDGSSGCDQLLGQAFEHAQRFGAELVAVHCVSDAESSDDQRQPNETDQSTWDWDRWAHLSAWQGKYPSVAVRRVVTDDRPRHALLGLSLQARLAVVGSRGRGGVEGLLLGSTSQALLLHAQCPVLVARTAPVSAGD